MIRKILKKQTNIILAIATAVLLVVVTLAATVFGLTDLTSNVAVTDLVVQSTNTTDWTASAGAVSWSGTTESSTSNCQTTFTPKEGTLVLENNSAEARVLSFTYNTVTLNDGTLKVDGTSIDAKATGGSFTKTLAAGASITISVKSAESATNATTVKLTNIKLEAQRIDLVFKAPLGGSYTVGNQTITSDTAVNNPNTTTYKLVATPAENYYFAGWYLGDTKVYDSATVAAAAFNNSGNITAKFAEDPVYAIATTPEGSAYTKGQLISVNTWYYHNSKNSLTKDGTIGESQADPAYSKTAQSGTKDKIDVQFIPSLPWNDNLIVSMSGTAMSDYVTGGLQESFAYVHMYSDVIRIYAKENCTISFDFANNTTISGDSVTNSGTIKNSTVYAYITTASNASVSQIKGSTTKYTATSGSSGDIALSKGSYLYILTEYFGKIRYMSVLGGSNFTCNFAYSASISNISVAYNEKKDVLTSGFREAGTNRALSSGQIIVNNVGQNIGANGNITDMTFADLAFVELKVGSVPANYVHIGWAITPEGGTTSYHYTPTYSRTLTENVTVNALFAPKMTIQMGANGYSDATYTLFDGTSESGQYVARNTTCTAYYTSLSDAFSKTDTVVLLAGATIIGDWTIPTGKTFVIPYGMNDEGGTTPTYAYGMGADYCLVNLNGNLTVNGTLIVSAQQNQSTGAPGGNPGHLVVAAGKTITVSGSLYAYGPVTGSGKVETTATAKIHETLEFSDNTVVIYIYNIYNERKSKKVFPFNTMFINSIEIPVTYQLGATLTAHVAIRYDTVCAAEVPIIAGSDAMMNHTTGTITKYFDHEAGQFVFRFDEGSKVSTGAFSLTVNATIASVTRTITMNSADYYVPLSAPFRFEVAGELIINGTYKFLPGMTVDVQPSGTLTIADGSEVVLYRRNDYDYRGKHANSTEQWGFSEVAYPQNPQRFNSVTYSFTFSNSNMGSAKLNVDGKLIVNGGLYVTDDLMTEGNGISYTTDGYNYLTGTGSINMTNAATSLKYVNEVLRAASTNDLDWDTVAVVPIKGLKADATANEAAQYKSLEDVMYGRTNEYGLNVWYSPSLILGDFTVQYRLQDYLWLNATCTLNDQTVTQADVTSGALTVNNGASLCVDSKGTIYLVKQIPSDELHLDQTFTITYESGDTLITAPFTVNLTAFKVENAAAGTKEAVTNALIDSLVSYGQAAYYFFENSSEYDGTLPATPSELVNASTVTGTGGEAGSSGGVTVSRKGVTFAFGERISLVYGMNLTVTDWSKVAQIGVLTGPNGTALLTLDSDSAKAYLRYNSVGMSSEIENTPFVTPTVDYNGDGKIDENDLLGDVLTSADQATLQAELTKNGFLRISYDILSAEYDDVYALRPFVVLTDGTVVYGEQINNYGLKYYIARRLPKANNVEKNFLINTWNYLEAVQDMFDSGYWE